MKKGFNFLKPQIEPPSAWTSIYEWITKTAKAVLIVFEIAVILALIIRIFVDVQAKNIDEQIDTLETIMQSRSFEEQKYLNLQYKTKGYTTLITNGMIYSEVFNQINSFIPKSSIAFDVDIKGSSITISGNALSSEIYTMEKGLKESILFKNTKLSILETQANSDNQLSKYSFILEITNPIMRNISNNQDGI